MSYLTEYTVFLRILQLFGICSFAVTKQTGRVKSNACYIAYNLAFFLILTSATTALAFYEKFSREHFKIGDDYTYVQVILDTMQETTGLCSYSCVILVLIKNRQKHEDFLNGIVELDNKILRVHKVDRVDSRKFFRRICIENTTFMVTIYGLASLCDFVLNNTLFIESLTFLFILNNLASDNISDRSAHSKLCSHAKRKVSSD